VKTLRQLAAAVQFMTRIPMPAFRFEPEMVLDAAKFYPLVGALVALGAIGLERGLRSHLPSMVVALAIPSLFYIRSQFAMAAVDLVFRF
jgi:cobalamin synthase